jgi:hypothetical protein
MKIESHTEVKIHGIWHHYSARQPKIISDIIEWFVPVVGMESQCFSEKLKTYANCTSLTALSIDTFKGSIKHIGILSSMDMAIIQRDWRSRSNLSDQWKLTEEFGYIFANDYEPPAQDHLGDFPVGLEDFRIIYWAY